MIAEKVKKTEAPVRVRMAPSPTGILHIGTARTALFNWLFARHTGGTYILRIENTDEERSKLEHEIGLIEGLRWLGLDWDEGPEISGDDVISKGPYAPYRQSERAGVYREYLERLLAEKKAYYCCCTKKELEEQRASLEAAGLPPKYTGRCRDLKSPPAGRKPEVIRFRVPEVKVKFHDIIRGSVEFDASLFGDIVIARSLDSALYNFANVVDDELMEISHVIRGEDHISNTPKQILMQRALNFREPQYAHLPLILNPDRSKFSKRTNKASLIEYKNAGFLPEAVVNFLALLGWHPKDDKEFMTRQDLIEKFDLARVQKAGAVFSEEKLNWLNGQHIRRFSTDDLAARVKPFLDEEGIETTHNFLLKVLELEKYRLTSLKDFVPASGFFFSLPQYDPDTLVWKNDSREKTLKILEEVYVAFASHLDVGFVKAELVEDLKPLTDREGKGSVLWPLRVALSGREASPDPFEIAEVLGKHETLQRLEWALSELKGE